MQNNNVIEIPVRGMDCAECAEHVQKAIANLPGVQSVDVFLASEKALIKADTTRVSLPMIRNAIAEAGYSVPEAESVTAISTSAFTRSVMKLFGVVFGLVLLIVVAGEWLGLFEAVTERIPPWLGYVLVLIAASPVLHNVIRAALKRQVTSHTLMTVGLFAALIVGEWVTAAIVVLFMHTGEYV